MNFSKRMLCTYLKCHVGFLIFFLVVSSFNIINCYDNRVVIRLID